MELLEKICNIHAPSGEEYRLSELIIDYFEKNKKLFKNDFKIFHGDKFQDSVVVVIGKPKIAVFAHMDSTGFTARYNNELIQIGSPHIGDNIKLKGYFNNELIKCNLKYYKDDVLKIDYEHILTPGTSLTFDNEFINSESHLQSSYLDNRLGVRNAIDLALNIENGIIIFSCFEEHGGGSVEKIANIIYNKYKITKALIYDITWETEGVKLGNGLVISIRDKMIPRKKFIDKIIQIAKNHNLTFQLEVESSGSSDGGYIQKSAFPIDWCFIGIACQNIHSSFEKVHKNDILEVDKFYRILMKEL